MLKKFALAVAAISLPSAALADPTIETKWDDRCNDNNYTMAVRAKNNEPFAVDMRLCLKSKNGRWTCWVSSNVPAGQWNSSSWYRYVCGATGDYFWSTRRAGSSVEFDNPPGYISGF